MSWETQAWAARQRPGRPADKLVLLALASCSNANHQAHPSVNWLAEFGDLDRKTVNTALRRLEEAGLISWTGERCGRTMQVKVYRLNALAEAAPAREPARLDSDPDSAVIRAQLPANGTGPKTEQFQKRNSSVFSGKQAQKRATEPFLEPNTPTTSNEVVTPPAILQDDGDGIAAGAAPAPAPVQAQPHRLPDGWQVPALDELPPMARRLVGQWPAGAYHAMAEAFRLHWTAEQGTRARKTDWTAALAKWLINDHSRVMRDMGKVSYAAAAPVQARASAPASAVLVDTPAKRRESGASYTLHHELAKALGGKVYDPWLAPCALLVGDDAVTVVASSEFHLGRVEAHFTPQIRAAVRAVLGQPLPVRFEVQRPQATSEGARAHG